MKTQNFLITPSNVHKKLPIWIFKWAQIATGGILHSDYKLGSDKSRFLWPSQNIWTLTNQETDKYQSNILIASKNVISFEIQEKMWEIWSNQIPLKPET